jgi:ATP-dependent Lon protease
MSNRIRKRDEDDNQKRFSKKSKKEPTDGSTIIECEDYELQSEKIIDNSEEDEDEDDTDEEDTDYEDDEYNMEKLELNLKKEDLEAYNSLLKVKDELVKTEPNIIKILKEPMREIDRSRLVQYYEIYKSSEINTEDWLDARDKVNKMHKDYTLGYAEYSKYSPEQHKKMETEVNTFSSYDSQLALKYKILGLTASKDAKQIIYNKYLEFVEMKPADDEYGKLKHWIKWATDIPHDRIKTFTYQNNLTSFLQHISKRMDEELYGMKQVKEQLLIFINSKLLNPNMKKCNLGLVGLPGVGKTAISKLLASVMDYPFQQIFFGGVSNPDFLKGHEYTYVGAQPGEIVKCLKRMGYKNGILFLDEYEKVSKNKAVCSALLQITDFTQNHEYLDNFLGEFTIDLSHLWFIYSMNKLPEDDALKDRIFSIEVPGYNYEDKCQIIQNYLIPKALKNSNIPKGSITISDKATRYLISKVCDPFDKGVRTVDKAIDDIMKKINFIIKHQDETGKLIGFNVSFKLGHKLTLPLNITESLLTKFIEDKNISTTFMSMYM